MTRSLHPKKEVEAALRHAETHGWRVTVGGPMPGARSIAPGGMTNAVGEFCITSVWSTPRNPGNHARLAARGRQLHRARRPTRRAPRNSDGIHLHPEIPAGQRCRGHGRRHRALGEAGCDDALAGIGCRAAWRWNSRARRPAPRPPSAVRWTMRRALPDARLIEAAPDLVGLTDVAEIAGVSRAGHAQADAGVSGQLPVPVHEGTTSLWHLADLLEWLRARGNAAWPPALAEVARAALQVNLAGKAPGLRLRRRSGRVVQQQVPGRRARHRARG